MESVEERLSTLEKAVVVILKDEVLSGQNTHEQLKRVIKRENALQEGKVNQVLGFALCLLFCFLVAYAMDWVFKKPLDLH